MSRSQSYEQGLAALKAGRIADAQRAFELAERESGTLEHRLTTVTEADTALREGRVTEAAALYSRLLDHNPARVEPYVGLARLALLVRRLPDARVHAQAALKVGPEAPLPWVVMALVLEGEGQRAQAAGYLEKAVTLDPRCFLAHYNLGRLRAVTGDLATGVESLRLATTLDPSDAGAWRTLGQALHDLGREGEAFEAFEHAARAEPGDLASVLTLAQLDAAAGRLERAASRLEPLLTTSAHPAVLESAAALAMLRGDGARASVLLEQLLTTSAGSVQLWLTLARLRLAAGDGDGSQAAARRALELDPASWHAWLHLGDLFDAVADEPQAHTAYRHALQHGPDEWKVLLNFGAALTQSKSADTHAHEAKSLLRRAVERAPAGEWRPHATLALALGRFGEPGAALELIARTLPQVPPASKVHAELLRLQDTLSSRP